MSLGRPWFTMVGGLDSHSHHLLEGLLNHSHGGKVSVSAIKNLFSGLNQHILY